MRYFLDVGGRSIELEVDGGEAEGAEFTVTLPDGRALRASFDAVDDCQHALLLDGRAYAVSIEEDAGDARALHVAIAGESFPVRAIDERERAAEALDAGGRGRAELLKAAMPGILVSVSVAPGDVVEPGQAVAVLEAMKMQNEVTCKHGGVVAEVLVQAGQTVDGGQPLVRFEAPEEEA